MISFWPMLATVCAMALLYVQNRYNILLEVAEGDEDIKIAPGSFSQPRGEDGADLAAQDFLRQKRCGNIDRARDLGSRYAQALLRPDIGPLASEAEGKTPLMQHHIFLLYAYVVSHVIADHSPNSILAQASLSIFHSEVEAGSPEMMRHINDTAAFSLYILYERSASRADEVGRVFAGLVGEETDAALSAYGNRLYDKIYHYCVDEIIRTKYVDVQAG